MNTTPLNDAIQAAFQAFLFCALTSTQELAVHSVLKSFFMVLFTFLFFEDYDFKPYDDYPAIVLTLFTFFPVSLINKRPGPSLFFFALTVVPVVFC